MVGARGHASKRLPAVPAAIRTSSRNMGSVRAALRARNETSLRLTLPSGRSKLVSWRSIMNAARLLFLIIVLSLTGGAVFAQTPALDAGVAPHINLTAAQKQTVYQSIRKTQKNNAAPIGFRATIGAIVA